MKRYAILTAVNVLTALAILGAQSKPVNIICFDPRTARHYNAQGHAGYTFRTTNGNALVIETKGTPGAVICTDKSETPAEKRLNETWPRTGC